ncbi:MAG: DegV family protein [Lachnospiraceae bacterium]|nr:DegV family protein [Lachnospiraceae bacterium]
MNYQIVSDGACDLLTEYVTTHNVTVVPFYVTFDGKNYLKEGEGIDHDSFYLKMINEHAVPKSSLPSVQDYINAFTPFVKENMPIICTTISAKFSGSYNSALAAKDILTESYPDAKIAVIDSTLNTASQALFVNEAVRLRDGGISFEDSVKELENIKSSGKIFFTVGSLEYLIKNGRIGKLAVIAGDKLGIRPTIIMQNGDISLGGISRSRKKSLASVLSCIESFFKKPENHKEDFNFVTACGYNYEEEIGFRKQLEDLLGIICDNNVKVRIGTTIGCHTGPYALGVGIIKKTKLI